MLFDFMQQIGPNMGKVNPMLDFSRIGNPDGFGTLMPMIDAAVPTVTPGFEQSVVPMPGDPTKPLLNGIMPGEWDWMKTANMAGSSGPNPQALAALAAMQQPQQQTPIPQAPAVNLGGRGGAPQLTKFVQRNAGSIPALGG